MTNEEQRILSMMDISCEKTHGFNCPGCDTAISKIVAEAERRGEVKAWEEARDIVMDEAVGYTEEALATDGMGEISAEFKSEALRFIQGVFDAKLNALK